MSLSNILGPASNSAPKAASPTPTRPAAKPAESAAFVPPPPPPLGDKVEKVSLNGEKRRLSNEYSAILKPSTPKTEMNGAAPPIGPTPVALPKLRRALNEKENKKVKEAGFAIDNKDNSDVEDGSMAVQKKLYVAMRQKRARDIDYEEFMQQKVSCPLFSHKAMRVF